MIGGLSALLGEVVRFLFESYGMVRKVEGSTWTQNSTPKFPVLRVIWYDTYILFLTALRFRVGTLSRFDFFCFCDGLDVSTYRPLMCGCGHLTLPNQSSGKAHATCGVDSGYFVCVVSCR